jgi:hypothetical protein
MRSIKTVMTVLATAAFLAACGGSDDNFDDRADLAEPKVRFVHAIPDGPDVTLFRGDEAQSFASDVGYLFASTYNEVDDDRAEWRVETSTGGLEIGAVDFNPERGDKYTLIALPGASGTGSPNVLFIEDPYNKGLSDDARVRVVNGSFNAPEIDVYLTGPSTDLTTATPRFDDVDYGDAEPDSGDDSVQLEGGTYRLRITTADTKNVIFSADVALDDNEDWLLLTVPDGATGIKVLVVKADDADETTEELTNALD